MIDYEKSADLNDCTVEWLKTKFERFPHSSKKIVAVCNECDKERKIKFQDYGDLCVPCSQKKQHKDNPERYIESNKKHKKFMKIRMRDEDILKSISDKLKLIRKEHPEIWDAARENQRGGNDIVNHHYIYDHNDPTKYTIGIIRTQHSALHRLLEKLNYVIPHINMTDENRNVSFNRR